MSTVDEQTIKKLAGMAKLGLSEQEAADYAHQLSNILGYVDRIGELPTDGIEPTIHVLDIHNIFREDRVSASNGAEILGSIAPQFEGGHVVVPIMIEDQE